MKNRQDNGGNNVKKENLTSNKQPKGKLSILTTALSVVAGLSVVALLAFILVTGSRTNPSYFTIEDGILTSYEGDDRVVTIPEGVVVIGERAFMGHEEMEKVVMPQTLTTLRNGAFYGCSSLETIKFSRALNFIGDAAFGECDALTSFEIPASVQFIHAETFYGSYGLTDVTVEEGNTEYISRDGVVYSADGKTLILYPAGLTAESFTVPAEVETIAAGAFVVNQSLQSVDLGNVLEVGDSAFYGCSALASVTFSDELVMIYDDAFGACAALTEVTIPASLQELSRGAFGSCPALTAVHLPAELMGIYEGAFEGSDNVTIYAPAGAPAEAFAKEYEIPFIAE